MTVNNSLAPPSLDRVFDILANKYRRRLLVALLEHNPQDDEGPQIPTDVELEDEDLESFQIRMTNAHLPKLEDAGVIEWDQGNNTVRKGPRFDEIRPLLELMQNHADELPDD
ncbi:helix-turn-helix domain-containing protein [Natrinema gelatinilyticum]|uniref:helix-turn-helix domain-containing protein n=1 Tax=Natrinema gelatinilyticum TaxID=2961571 RepID=UPI0020C2F612|nr:helix-turn-helix domain-containing protein [Natrinema gelatinilyticum]